MVSDSKTAISPTERLMRKRLAARLRQQRCRARKKELSLAKKQREQQETKGTAHVPAQARRPMIVPRNHVVPAMTSHSFARQPSHGRHPPHHKPLMGHHHHQHQPPHQHQPHRPHRPLQNPMPHHVHHGPAHHLSHQPPHQGMHVAHSHPPPPPPPPPHHHGHGHHHHRHHPGHGHYASHRAMPPLYATEPPVSRTHSIGSVVSFDDGSCPAAPKPYDSIPMPPLYVKPEKLFVASSSSSEDFELPVPTVSPSMASEKPIVEPDPALLPSVPSRSPTKEETAIDAMLSLRSASFGV